VPHRRGSHTGAARYDEPRFDMIESMTGPNLDRPLRTALPRLRQATGVDGAMAGPVSLGGRRLVVTGLHGMLTSTMLGLVATPGVGAGGQALQMARPFAVDDYLHSKTVSHHFDRKVQIEQIYGVLAVPVRVGRDIRAVLYGLSRTASPLGDRVLDIASSVAAMVARELAVEIEVAHRMHVIAQHQHREDSSGPGGVDPREIYEELIAIARATSDRSVRDRLEALCGRLSPRVGPAADGAPRLTGREREVLAEIALGHTTFEVAEHLSIMPTTVKSYLKNIMGKLGTRNRVETLRAARRAGLVS
jgi:LuxR family transcriptional regulator, regulator of acetate metabolism